MFTLKTFTQKLVSTIIAASVALTGLAAVPSLAHAQGDKGLHLGVQLKAEHQDNKVKADIFGNFSGAVKTAKKTFRQAVKDANTAYKNAVKAARDKFHAAINATTDASAKISAFKIYMSEKLAAFKTKSAAIEAAFQAFINTNFNQNQAPVANAQNVTVQQNTSANITLSGSDPENSPLSYLIVSTTTHGTLSGTTPNLIYMPSTNFTGQDSFTFKVNDGSLNSTLKTVTITVNQ